MLWLYPRKFSNSGECLQKRNWKTNCCLVLFPVILVVLLVVIQAVVNRAYGSTFKCGCKCVPDPNGGPCIKTCGLEYSDDNEAPYCGVPNPAEWPAVLQIPGPQYMAIQGPEGSPRVNAIPYTGTNKSVSDSKLLAPCLAFTKSEKCSRQGRSSLSVP